MKEKITYMLFSIAFIVISCKDTGHKIYRDKPCNFIDSLANSANKPYCIILLDTSHYLSKEYIATLERHFPEIDKYAIINMIDVSSDQYTEYLKLLEPKSLPLTCIFDGNGKLFDLIPGSSKESFLYTQEALSSLKTTDYHWPNLFGAGKLTVLPILSNLWETRRNLSQHESKTNDIVTIPDSLEYPYSAYLNLLIAKEKKDSLLVDRQARKLLKLKKSNTLEVYKDEFIEAEKLLDPDFQISQQQQIRVDSIIIKLENCRVNQSYPIDVMIHNDGTKPLTLERIWNSCSCVKLLGADKDVATPAMAAYTAKFIFTPVDTGDVSRDIYIESDAYNTPFLNIKIQANVNKQL